MNKLKRMALEGGLKTRNEIWIDLGAHVVNVIIGTGDQG